MKVVVAVSPSANCKSHFRDTVARETHVKQNFFLRTQIRLKTDIGQVSLQYQIMDQSLDDDTSLARHARQHSRHLLHHRFDKRPSISWWHRCMWFLDFLTSPRFGVMMAVLVIVGMQYKAEISTFLSSLVENGLRETLLDCLLVICDLARSYYQVARELVRSLFSSWGAQRSVSLFHKHTTQGGRLPPLIICAEMHEAVGEEYIHNSPCRTMDASSAYSEAGFEQVKIHFEDIQPAFLNDVDYPRGWLTYHRVLGVVSKHEADEYNLKFLCRSLEQQDVHSSESDVL